MRNSPWYIVALVAFIGGAMGYTQLTSEIQTLEVVGKYVEEGRSRYGMSSEVYVIETNMGHMPILKFPIIGHTFDSKEEYERIVAGSEIRVRVGFWPPNIFNNKARPQIMAVY